MNLKEYKANTYNITIELLHSEINQILKTTHEGRFSKD